MAERIKLMRGRIHLNRFAGPLLIVLFVLVANGLYITKQYNPNPINLESGLINELDPGPVKGQPTIDPSDGYYAQSLGRRAAIDLAHGHIPWWNHYEGVGAPLIGGMQSAALFPLQFLLVLPNGIFYFHVILEMVAGIGVYYLLRRLCCVNTAAIVGGCAFAVNGTYAWIGHTIVNPIAFLPWLLLGVEIARDHSQRERARGWTVIAMALALSLYAGFPETGFMDASFVAGWAIIRAFGLPRPQLKLYGRKLAAGALVGLLLAAPILIAFAGYLPYANVGLHAQNTANLILPKAGLTALIMPYAYGPIFANWTYDASHTVYSFWANVGGYVGVALLPLAIIGLFSNSFRRLDKRYLTAWAVVCVLATYGLFDVNKIVGSLPLFSSAAFARYLPPTYELAIVILAAMGLTYIWEKRGDRKIVKLASWTALSLVVCIIGTAVIGNHIYHVLHLANAPYIPQWFYGSIAASIFLVVAICILAIYKKNKVTSVLLITLVLLEVVAMYAVPVFSAPKKATIDLGPVLFLKNNLGQERFFTLGPIQPNYGSYYGIASANVNDVPQPKLYSNYIQQKLDPNVSPIIFTGVSSTDPQKISPTQAFFKNIKNYETIGVKYLVAPKNVLTGEDITSTQLKSVYDDGQVVIFALPNPQPYIMDENGSCSIQPVSSTDRDEFTVNCPRPTDIIRREQFIPGWEATIDGHQTLIYKQDNLLQKVHMPAGTHKLKFVYAPPHINIGYTLAALGVLIIGGQVVLKPAKRNKAKKAQAIAAEPQDISRRGNAEHRNSRKTQP